MLGFLLLCTATLALQWNTLDWLELKRHPGDSAVDQSDPLRSMFRCEEPLRLRVVLFNGDYSKPTLWWKFVTHSVAPALIKDHNWRFSFWSRADNIGSVMLLENTQISVDIPFKRFCQVFQQMLQLMYERAVWSAQVHSCVTTTNFAVVQKFLLWTFGTNREQQESPRKTAACVSVLVSHWCLWRSWQKTFCKSGLWTGRQRKLLLQQMVRFHF